MQKTKIEWVKNPDGTQGYTWNPITGCLNHINGMCKGGNFPCYAYRLAHGRLKERYRANKNIAGSNPNEGEFYVPVKMRDFEERDPFYPRFWSSRICEPIIDGTPKGIFVCDMSDIFGIGVPDRWTQQVLQIIRNDTVNRFYLLTKQPQNLLKFSPFPDNCWVGVSVCNDKMLDVAVDKLEDIQAKVKFISFEPLLKHLTLSLDYAFYYSGISWLIIGAQTKPTVMPKIEWVREIVEAADQAGIPVFLKDSLDILLGQNSDFKKWQGEDSQGNNLYGLRQEMPRLSRRSNYSAGFEPVSQKGANNGSGNTTNT